MNAQQAENLRVLIRHMENVCTRVLNMGEVCTECGTPACAIGEATLIPQFGLSLLRADIHRLDGSHVYDQVHLMLRGQRAFYSDAARDVFGVSKLFSSNGGAPMYPREWAARARVVLTECGYSMDAKPDAFQTFMAKVQEPVAVTA